MEKKRRWFYLRGILYLKNVKCKTLQVFLLQMMLLIPWEVMAGTKGNYSLETGEDSRCL